MAFVWVRDVEDVIDDAKPPNEAHVLQHELSFRLYRAFWLCRYLRLIVVVESSVRARIVGGAMNSKWA